MLVHFLKLGEQLAPLPPQATHLDMMLV